MIGTYTPSWPTPPAPDTDTAAALQAYEALPAHERARVARLVSQTGAPIALAVAAVVALRPADV
jgi:hypothetical protein